MEKDLELSVSKKEKNKGTLNSSGSLTDKISFHRCPTGFISYQKRPYRPKRILHFRVAYRGEIFYS